MNFHSNCPCKLEVFRKGGVVVHYAITSYNEHVGTLRFYPSLTEWTVHLSQHVCVTYGFMAKIWTCLFNELTSD